MSRSYDVASVEYPSVTTVLGILDKYNLRQWAADCAVDALIAGAPESEARTAWKATSGRAMDIGSIVHRAIHMTVKRDKPLTYRPRDNRIEVRNAYQAWLEWERDIKPRFVKVEEQVVNMSEMYAGTLDAIIEADGKTYVVDYKTSAYQSYEYGMQIAAYGAAAGIPPGYYGMLVNLDKKTGAYKIKVYTPHDLNELYMAFSTLLQYYYMSAARRLKNNSRAKDRA